MYRPFKPFPSALYPCPDPVYGQVFFEHGHFIDRWSWLDFRKLTFRRSEWDIEAIVASGISRNSEVRYFASDSWRKHLTERKRRLATFFRQGGTWPVPPVVIRITQALGLMPQWAEYSGHWLLIEGHYRMGMVLRRYDQLSDSKLHELWLGERLKD